MARYTKTGTPTTIGQISAELDLIATAINDTYSRVGDTPNQLESTLDANSNHIINLPPPTLDGDPIRRVDVVNGGDALASSLLRTDLSTGNVDAFKTVVKYAGVTFDNIAAMKAGTLVVGDVAVCKRYYAGGDLIDGLIFEIQANQSVNELFSHTLNNANTAILQDSNITNPKKGGAIGDRAGANGVKNLEVFQYMIDNLGGVINFGTELDRYAISGGSLVIGFGNKLLGGNSQIVQFTDNIPIIICGSSRWKISGIWAEYATQQDTAKTQAYGILLDSTFESIIENCLIRKSYRGIGVNKRDVFDDDSYCYMMSLIGTRSANSSDWGFYFNNDGSTGMTTNTFIGCYALQDANSNENTASKGFYIGAHSGGATLIGCASDKSQSTALTVTNSTNIKLISFDIESSSITDTELVNISSCTNLSIDGILIDVNVFNGTNCNVIRVSGSSRNIEIRGREKSSTNNATTTFGLQSTSTREDCWIEAFDFISDSNFLRDDNLTPNGKRQILSYAYNIYAEKIGINNRLEYRTSYPTTGTWAVGDRVKNPSISNANPVDEWACVVAGTSGSWRVVSSVTVKGATAARPTLTASDFGVQYLDTTLNANGLLIVWSGSLWLDSSGNSV